MSAEEVERLLLNKQQLGPITCLDCTKMDIVSAHQRLGQDARAQIHKTLRRRFELLGGPEQFASQIRRARQYQVALAGKPDSLPIDDPVQTAIRQYQACLAAWADGAGLGKYQHAYMNQPVDGLPVNAKDLATLLQEDETGCQTGVLREAGGAVILWHTEEDYEETPGQRFDQLRLFTFRAAGDQVTCGFTYPDLLPGPTFGWQVGDFAQAIDSLHVRPVNFEDAILPNTLAWLSLYLGARISRSQLAAKLGPFQGGYSLTAVSKKGGQAGVEKLDFANNQAVASTLEEAPGSSLFQTNVIRDLSLPIGREEKTSPESRAWNEKRMARTTRLLRVIQNSADGLGPVFRLLRSRLGGPSAYANSDVKAYFVCRMAADETSIYVGAGPALRGDDLFTLEM
ncbi:MAG TPA: hypothetical protein VGK00_06470 [Anaerolineales bacterium]|jgi:hypothetical protein